YRPQHHCAWTPRHLRLAGQSAWHFASRAGAPRARSNRRQTADYRVFSAGSIRRGVGDLRRAPRRSDSGYPAPLSAMTAELENRASQSAGSLDIREALRLMLTIRFFDERALALYRAGEMLGQTHPDL